MQERSSGYGKRIPTCYGRHEYHVDKIFASGIQELPFIARQIAR